MLVDEVVVLLACKTVEEEVELDVNELLDDNAVLCFLFSSRAAALEAVVVLAYRILDDSLCLLITHPQYKCLLSLWLC